MLALAIVVLVLVIFLVVVSFVGTSQDVVVDFANVTITASVGEVFVAGVVAGLVALASLVALRISVRGLWNRHKEVRELRRQVGATDEHGPSGTRADGPESEAGSGRSERSAAAPPTEARSPKERTTEDETEWTPPDEEQGRSSGGRPTDEPRS